MQGSTKNWRHDVRHNRDVKISFMTQNPVYYLWDRFWFHSAAWHFTMTSRYDFNKLTLTISAYRCARKIILFLSFNFSNCWVRKWTRSCKCMMTSRHVVTSWRHHSDTETMTFFISATQNTIETKKEPSCYGTSTSWDRWSKFFGVTMSWRHVTSWRDWHSNTSAWTQQQNIHIETEKELSFQHIYKPREVNKSKICDLDHDVMSSCKY